MPRIAPQEHRNGMVKAYLSGHSLEKSAALFGYWPDACRNELRRRHIPTRGRGEANRKYAVDESFFDTIDSEARAYFLGFLSADGCVRRAVIKIGLAAKDKGHLVKLLATIKSEHPICEGTSESWGKKYFYARVEVNSAKLIKALRDLGVMPRKSLILMPCQQVPEKLAHHYWRAMIDGDGWISGSPKRGCNTLNWKIGFCGSEGMVRGFDAWVKTFVRTKVQPGRRRGSKIFQVHYGGIRQVKTIIEQLYCDATIWLDRKHEQALAVMETEIQHQDWSNVTPADLMALYAQHKTWKAVASAMGMPIGTISNIKKRLLAQEQSNTAKGI